MTKSDLVNAITLTRTFGKDEIRLGGVGEEEVGEGAVEALLAVLVVGAGDEFEAVGDTVVVEVGDDFLGVGLDGLEGLDTGFCLLVAEQEVCAA